MILMDILNPFSTSKDNIFFRLYHYLSILFPHLLFHSFKKAKYKFIGGWPQEKILINITIHTNTKKVIILMMRTTTEQIMMIIIIISTNRNNNQVITTTMMIMKIIKKYLIAIAMTMIIANIVITLQKTKNMSVKQDSLRASLSNQ